MFIFTTDTDGALLTLTLGNKARYDIMRQTNPALRFLELTDVLGSHDPKDIIQAPQSYRMISDIGLIRTR